MLSKAEDRYFVTLAEIATRMADRGRHNKFEIQFELQLNDQMACSPL